MPNPGVLTGRTMANRVESISYSAWRYICQRALHDMQLHQPPPDDVTFVLPH